MSEWLLVIDDLEVIYDRAILALRGITLRVRAGRVVALLGTNGAGKSTARWPTATRRIRQFAAKTARRFACERRSR